jgi:hypothetical protein
VPPAPQATTGPKRESATTPTSISTPAGAIAWTRKPSTRWPSVSSAERSSRALRVTALAPCGPVALLEALARGAAQLGGQLDLQEAGLGTDLHGEARVAQHAQHAVVVRMHEGRQGHDAGRLGDLGEVRKHERGDPAPLPRVGHGEGQLRPFAIRLGDQAGMGDDVPVDAGGRDEAYAVIYELARRTGGGDAPAQEAKPARVGRQALEEGRHGIDVGGDGRAHVDRGAVAQHDVRGSVGRGGRRLEPGALRRIGDGGGHRRRAVRSTARASRSVGGESRATHP